MAIEKFTSTINREGSTGTVRGKLSAGLISAIGAKEGDVLEIHVNKGTIVGGHVMTGKEARQFRGQGRQSFGNSNGSAPAKKKVVGKSKSSAKAQTSGKKSGKSNKNKTSVKVSKSKSGGKKGRVVPKFKL